MFDELFHKKRPIPEKLISYGFQKQDGFYQYSAKIQDGEFLLAVQLYPDRTVRTSLTGIETGEPYILYQTSASGAYVGEIRSSIARVLSDIAESCCEPEIFQTRQARLLISHVKELYGDELEFLWKKFPGNAVWRRKDSQKWYAVILTVAGKKIGLPTNDMVEIIDLRMNPAESEALLSRDHYYPGWHMNKKSWYTLVLDGGVPDGELFLQLSKSYALAGHGYGRNNRHA